MIMNEDKIQRFARAWVPDHCMIISADAAKSDRRALFLLCGHDTMQQYKRDVSNIKKWKRDRIREVMFDDMDNESEMLIKDTARSYYDTLINARYRDKLIKLDTELVSI